jgi:hypothetical protein
MAKTKNRYLQIIEKIFELKHKKGAKEVIFEREDLVHTAKELEIPLPKNLGDILYSFRYRANLPECIRARAPEGLEWVIRPVGKARYKFALASMPRIVPSELMAETKIPDATPGIIAKYALSDEQAVLAKIRYNRLVDIFTGVTCYSLQSHLRTTVSGMGQVETDELYVGIDQRGAQYVFPVQAKGGADRLGVVQIEQDFAMCATKFPALICRPIAALFIEENLIALFAFEEGKNGVAISAEKHYRLVTPEEMTPEDLIAYRNRPLSSFQ